MPTANKQKADNYSNQFVNKIKKNWYRCKQKA